MINVVERASTTIMMIQTMVGCVLMTEVNILQTGQTTVIVAMNGKEENNAFNIAVGAVRDWIGVMNSEKKYRNKKMSGRD